MNGTNADFAAEADRTAGERSSELDCVDVFLTELGRLKRIVAGMGLSASDGEDVLQDVSVQALKWAGKFDSKEQCVRWLIRVTVNRCLTEYRSRRRFRRRVSEILKRRQDTKAGATSAEARAIAAEELEIVRESLQQLDESLLGPLVLRYFCDMNSREVSEILDLSPSTVRSRLREARMILAKGLAERGVEP